MNGPKRVESVVEDCGAYGKNVPQAVRQQSHARARASFLNHLTAEGIRRTVPNRPRSFSSSLAPWVSGLRSIGRYDRHLGRNRGAVLEELLDNRVHNMDDVFRRFVSKSGVCMVISFLLCEFTIGYHSAQVSTRTRNTRNISGKMLRCIEFWLRAL
jgi:hypothetical protein